ncbi:hypothetical protein [Cryobacterium sp. 10I5]|uniref:hypothetical protein n=1 Tax=Cryobacterium sp. 10I5 TaxID=3048581 RepID=UPI002B226AA5|nr:hypothetical protein [Cryobacterium sp. 10I5]MEB0266892.1 hypothetical protein [Cryobacterium sp. 10I5]
MIGRNIAQCEDHKDPGAHRKGRGRGVGQVHADGGVDQHEREHDRAHGLVEEAAQENRQQAHQERDARDDDKQARVRGHAFFRCFDIDEHHEGGHRRQAAEQQPGQTRIVEHPRMECDHQFDPEEPAQKLGWPPCTISP